MPLHYNRTLSNIVKIKQDEIQTYKKTYVEYGTTNGELGGDKMNRSIGTLNGANDKLINLRQEVIINSKNQQQNMEKSMKKYGNLVSESKELMKYIRGMEDTRNTSFKSLNDKSFLYKKDFASVIGKLACIGILIAIIRS